MAEFLIKVFISFFGTMTQKVNGFPQFLILVHPKSNEILSHPSELITNVLCASIKGDLNNRFKF